MFQVEPWGDDRSDLRSAVATANVMAQQMSEKPSEDDFHELVEGMSRYLMVNQKPDEAMGPEQAANLMRAMTGG
jgi:hypothetical protein